MEETKLVTERKKDIISLKVSILCSNNDCSSRDQNINIADILLLIGSGYKCPYCRNDKFVIIKK